MALREPNGELFNWDMDLTLLLTAMDEADRLQEMLTYLGSVGVDEASVTHLEAVYTKPQHNGLPFAMKLALIRQAIPSLTDGQEAVARRIMLEQSPLRVPKGLVPALIELYREGGRHAVVSNRETDEGLGGIRWHLAHARLTDAKDEPLDADVAALDAFRQELFRHDPERAAQPGILPLFDIRIAAGRIAHKPSPRSLFLAVQQYVERFGRPPTRNWMIGDQMGYDELALARYRNPEWKLPPRLAELTDQAAELEVLAREVPDFRELSRIPSEYIGVAWDRGASPGFIVPPKPGLPVGGVTTPEELMARIQELRAPDQALAL